VARIPSATRNALPWAPDYVDVRSLAVSTAKSWTVPAGIVSVTIWYTAGVLWMKKGGTAVVPIGDVSDGSASKVIGQGESFQVSAGDVLSFINATACFVVIGGDRVNSQ